MELFIQMNKMFGTTIILATHSSKMIETYKFPVMHVENHRLGFVGTSDHHIPKVPLTASKATKDTDNKNYFSELSKQFDNIGKL